MIICKVVTIASEGQVGAGGIVTMADVDGGQCPRGGGWVTLNTDHQALVVPIRNVGLCWTKLDVKGRCHLSKRDKLNGKIIVLRSPCFLCAGFALHYSAPPGSRAPAPGPQGGG